MKNFELNPNCDGSGPHTFGTVKVLSSGGCSNLIGEKTAIKN
jgi:hypothetical protein